MRVFVKKKQRIFKSRGGVFAKGPGGLGFNS